MTVVSYQPPSEAPSGVHQVVAYTRLGRELYPSFAPVIRDIRQWWNTPSTASRRIASRSIPSYLPVTSLSRKSKMRFPRKRAYQRVASRRTKTPRTSIVIPNRRIEVKQRQSALTSVALNTTSSVTRLGGVARGTTNDTREGNIIKRVSQELRIQFSTIGAGQQSITVRLILFTYRENQANVANFGDVLTTDSIYSSYDIRVMKNIQILKDVLIPIVAQAGVSGAWQARNVMKVYKLNERSSVEYDGSNNIDEGNKEIYMLIVANGIFGTADYIFTERFVDA